MLRGVLCILLLVPLGLNAQSEQHRLATQSGDTLHYTYTPLTTADTSAADTETTAKPRKGLLHSIVDYFGESTVDRSREKKIDITFAGGPSYSKTTKLGLGVLAAGLYRIDRQDTITPPSDLSIYANVTTSGFFSVGVTGHTIFCHDRRRADYDLSFSSAPRDVWGIGYWDGRYNPASDFVEECYQVKLRYLERLWKNTYAGALIDFSHTAGRKFDEVSRSYLYGQKTAYTATGFGVVLEYDSRDFIPNPARGIYFSIQQTLYPRGLGNCDKTLWRTTLRANAYQGLWKGATLAFDLYGECNSDGTPWPLLARLGGEERMRGYYEGRYTDRNLLTAQLEVRQHIWRRIGGVVWGGGGTVFHDFDRLRMREVLPNYGLGLRWELKHRVNVRMDYGFGRDTSGFLLSINEAF